MALLPRMASTGMPGGLLQVLITRIKLSDGPHAYSVCTPGAEVTMGHVTICVLTIAASGPDWWQAQKDLCLQHCEGL